MRIARVSAIAGDGLVASASIERNGFGLATSGLQANGPIAALGGDFFQPRQHGSSTSAAPMAVAHIHALYFDDALLHGPKRSTGHRNACITSDQKHTARCTEIRGVDAMDRKAGIACAEVAVERGNQLHCFRRSGVPFNDLQPIRFFAQYQNENLSAIWRILGSSALVTWPKVGVPKMVLTPETPAVRAGSGTPARKLLLRLKASARNSTRYLSTIGNSLETAISSPK